MDKMLRNPYTIALFIAPAFLLFLFVIPIPIFQTFYYSLTEWNVISEPQWIGLENFQQLFTRDPYFIKAISNTFIFALGSFILQIPFAFLVANILLNVRRFAGVFRSVFFFPCLLSATAVSLLWRFIYHPNMGLVNSALVFLSLEDFTTSWLSNQNTALFAVIVSVAWQWFGYHMVIFMTGTSSIPNELFESVKLEGASWGQTVRYITYPLTKPFIKISTVLITASSIKAFDSIYVLTGGGPNNASTVLALQMYNRAFKQMKYGYGSAISVLLMISAIVLVYILEKAIKIEEVVY
ncbi:carbohydrate ABC transporter permease [Sphaerochaeta halotolerans]|jgi:raffinose/stachyose/melibiose transport system permease protein|uniref:carbohydrate ABC transporter permease n=1 Tax=Sphaerochaeta halotolerans TaxID=2293840 RepID=UPI001370EFC9|nr:sugar ABC transporter permease [Sphaerochaeta halotolerans]MXI85234.1 ABC transporter permease subunit [Sphaerochaeta halotolerans]